MNCPIWLLLVIYLVVGTELSAQGFRTSRGGGIPPSRSFSPSPDYKTGSRSSHENVHQKHSRTAAREENPYRSFAPKPAVNHFPAEPTARPVYIPREVRRDNAVYPVVFHKNSYGYWHGSSFIAVEERDYATPTPGSALVRLIVVGLFLFIVVFVIASAVQGIGQRHARKRQLAGATRDLPTALSSEQPLLKKLYGVQSGKIITLSDPLTLSYYEKPLDLRVVETVSYRHATFSLFQAAMRNERDGETIYLFVKDVPGDFCMFMGIRDHEGRNATLRAQQWFHLEQSGDRFAKEFAAIFPPVVVQAKRVTNTRSGLERSESPLPVVVQAKRVTNTRSGLERSESPPPVKDKPELRVTFSQFEFGAFYDVVSSSSPRELVGVSEYHPQGTPEDFDWQHAIVLWEGGWISCYYCREIHSRNVEVF